MNRSDPLSSLIDTVGIGVTILCSLALFIDSVRRAWKQGTIW